MLAIALKVIGLSAVCLVGYAAWRIRQRRRRRVRRYLIRPYRSDEATGEQVRRMLEAWHRILQERWERRLLWGQAAMVLEVSVVRGESEEGQEGLLQGVITLAIPEELAESFEGRLSAAYPDTRMLALPQGAVPHGEAAVLLKKRRGFREALARPDEYATDLVHDVLNQMERLGEPATLGLICTPTPVFFERYARRRFTEREQTVEREARSGSGAGARSQVEQTEHRGGVESILHHPLFFCEPVVIAETLRTAERIAAVFAGGSAMENTLAPRRLVVRRRLYIRRLQRGLGKPIPSFKRNVLSSAELAGLWHLYSPFLKTVPVARSNVPRVPAGPEVWRPPAEIAVAYDDKGPVGIYPDDLSDSGAFLGTQGTGKSSLLLALIRGVVNERVA